ncbi:MAG: fibronectin type III domain-containing protein [Bacteroidetes bacterium]|nr:MAG: fibronectin type III domain-containing protein [Bacteroidota bacterium]
MRTVLFLLAFPILAAALPAPVFDQAAEVQSKSGYIKLSWQWDAPGDSAGSTVFELQQADNPAFDRVATIYRGPDLASFLSGLRNGVYYYRVRALAASGALPGEWSAPVQLQVEHHPLSLAISLFVIGAIVFSLTVVIVVRGARQTPLPGQ